ncbi:MAG: pur operon repressor [Clostridia bacterium]|nr:pur operon repressor [Clostridia bacterium]
MRRIKRSDRLGAMMQTLMAHPNRIHNFSEFCDMFQAAKSTISEDVDILKASVGQFGYGEIETLTGASGGVRYRASISPDAAANELKKLATALSKPERLLPGGFLYTSDITSNPEVASLLGRMLAQMFYATNPDFVLTMETKGIPIATMTAHMLGVPLVIARRDTRAYEGSAVKINYIAGGSGEKLETMALARRAVKPGQKAVIIDDFMKGGGTLKGMAEMMSEFQAEVVGVGVMIATKEPVVKRISGAKTLMTLVKADPSTGETVIEPTDDLTNQGEVN